MCQCLPEGQCAPTSELIITVTYCHDHVKWRATTAVVGHTVGGRTIAMATGSHEFGPFDGSTEVGAWISGQQRALRPMIAAGMFERLAES